MKSVFIDLRNGGDLLTSCRRAGRTRHDIDVQRLRSLPTSPFSYGVSDRVLETLASPNRLATRSTIKVGLQTSNDFRFCRLWWEQSLPPDPSRFPFAKGGWQRAYYSDIALTVGYSRGEQVALAEFGRYGRGATHYGLAGVNWTGRPHRAGRFIALPKRSIFSHNSPSMFEFVWGDECALAITNSVAFIGLLHLVMPRGTAGSHQTLSYEAGYVGGTPIPTLSAETALSLGRLARTSWSLVRSLDTANEVSHAFVVPEVLHAPGGSFGERVNAWAQLGAEVEVELAQVQLEIDELCFELYGISEKDRRTIVGGFSLTGDDAADAAEDAHSNDGESLAELDPVGLAAGLVAWAVGVVVGRFDVRLATGERGWPVEPEPFDPLPVCAPGMLTGADGLPVDELPADYAIEVASVLVDDPGHGLDLTARVRDVFDVVFGKDADRWWSDVGAVLDPKGGEVETWLRKGFFDHHLKSHSKSRRKAPIVWPLGTKSGSYRVWLCAHQVTADSLFRLLNDIVGPKLQVEERRMSDLRQEAGPSPSATQRKTIDLQESFVGELAEFRDELVAVTPLWAPDLNDGIVIALAPLWRLSAGHRAWSNELKSRWKKLDAGDYDWSQLAMHVWPERVIPKCAEDRSLAIAHDLEDVFWARDDNNADKWHPRQAPTTPIDTLVADRTNASTEAARNRPTP